MDNTIKKLHELTPEEKAQREEDAILRASKSYEKHLIHEQALADKNQENYILWKNYLRRKEGK